MAKLITVAVEGPLRRTFTYRYSESLGSLSPGQRLLVPFGKGTKVGFYLGPAPTPDSSIQIKSVSRIIDTESYFTPELFEFCLWMADYYFANPADCLFSALPSVFRKKRSAEYYWSDSRLPPEYEQIRSYFKPGRRLSAATLKHVRGIHNRLLARLVERGIVAERWLDDSVGVRRKLQGFAARNLERWGEYFKRKRFAAEPFDGAKSRKDLQADGWTDYQIRNAVKAGLLEPVFAEDLTPLLEFIEARANLETIQLNEEQQTAFDAVRDSLGRGFQAFLLHGVTGSGKTIVYCHLCREVIAGRRTALVLTPEIALTSTTLAYFRGFFGDAVTVLHSAMTERERLESWHGIRQGRFRIVVGPRSAVFAPLPDMGIVIVDEEHDSSYKQDDPSPRFHGRDSAVMRAKINKIPVLLGSASPSIESYHNALTGRYRLLELTGRPAGAALPSVRIIDMKTDRLKGDLPYLSFPLKKEVEERFKRDEQVILFLNRRGHSPQLKCGDCGYVPSCPHCRINLTFHRVGRKLSCHYCGYVITQYDTCPTCGSHTILYQGVGTQKVEENIPRLFEGARAVRLDSDTAAGRKRAYEILRSFSDKKNNLLLGTQMVTKGLDLPDVTLVGVLSADMSLSLPDFRASEKAFARLLQVAGRSGRSLSQGEVLIQTFDPENEVIADAARQDYKTFFNRELASRRDARYPPFCRIVRFELSGSDEDKVASESLTFRQRLEAHVKSHKIPVDILGPHPCPLYHLRGKFRRHLLVKTGKTIALVRSLTLWEESRSRFGVASSVKITVDVDPDDMM